MICPRCGARNGPRALFCSRCRAALPVRGAAARREATSSLGWVAAGIGLVFLLALIVGVGYLLGRQTAVPGAAPQVITATSPPATQTVAATSTPTAVPATVTPRPATRTAVPTAASPRPTATSVVPTASPTLVPTMSAGAGTPVTSTHGSISAAPQDQEPVRQAVITSNTAWTAAMETASPSGLDRIKTGSNLQAAVQAVRQLQARAEYWRITLKSLTVVWVRLTGPARAQALVRKVGEHRVLYVRGAGTPLQVLDQSYTNLYDLRLRNGRWLVALITPLDDATARQLAVTPPVRAVPSSAPTVQTASAAGTATPTTQTTPGVVSATSAAVVSTTPTAAAPPVLSAAAAEGVVRAFYAAITVRAYTVAYGLLSRELQAQLPAQNLWTGQFAREQEARVSAATPLLQGQDAAVVTLDLTTRWTRPDGSAFVRRYAGSWRLRAEGGQWRLASASLHRVLP